MLINNLCGLPVRLLIAAACLLALATLGGLHAEPVISEFMASNSTTLADDDGAFSDWIELYNPDSTAADLTGWYLTDTAKNKKKWPIPAVVLPPQGYLVIFASSKDRRDPARKLHTNFALSADGEYLALVRPDGETATTEFAPTFPAQRADVSYGSGRNASAGTREYGFLQSPTPGARNSLLQGVAVNETVAFSRTPGPFTGSFNLELSGAGANQAIRYVLIEPGTAGAAGADPTPDSPLYTGPLEITSSVVVKASVFLANDSSQGVSTSAQYVKIGGPTATDLQNFSSLLPVLILDDHGAGPLKKDNVDHPGWLYRYAPKRNGAPVLATGPDLATPITLSVHGTSSAGFPKKSYNLELRTPAGGSASLPLVGTTAAKKWVLVGPWFFDTTAIKNSFIYSLSNQIGRWAPGTQPVEVFFHTDGDLGAAAYAGVYVLTEKIEVAPQKVNLTPLAANSTDVTGGYLLKLDSPDSDEFGFSTRRDVPGGMSQVVVASAKAADLSSAQRDYIQTYIQDMEDTLVADFDKGFASRDYLDYIDRASWVDHHILNVFASNFDALERSAYFSKDRGGKLVAGPVWDFDRSFGAATYYATVPWNRWFVEGGVNFWQTGWWGYIAHDPEFMQDWVDRWQALRKGVFSDQSLVALADSLAANIGPDAAARDAAKWPDIADYAAGKTGGVAEMKAWFTNRVKWIDDQFVAAPAVSGDSATLKFVAPAGAQLAYTLDGSDPRSLGGRLAPNAVLTSAPLVVPASANVHVRGYRADREGVFPGSPWSSAVGGAASSPLAPTARIANISARALVGTGENALFAGIGATDTVLKGYLVRAVGPTLGGFGAANALPDSELSIRRADGLELYRNAGWQNGNDAASLAAVSRAVGAFPLAAASADSALLPTLSEGLYTVKISSPTGQTGVGLAELYELGTNGRTTNLSARANVRPGDGALLGGFVLQGTAYKRLLIRGIGPTLRALGIENALDDPILTIYSGQTAIATNDRWSSGSAVTAVTAATASVGAFALATGSEDAALLVTLAPGSYTVEVKGKNAGSGVALLEIYDVP
ncbi:MAG: CotH kinase family protein [Verrucomicrobia bacterium]|nr:CotH kinase family protein [Verrucomicrobiota bacterium]